MFKHCLLFDSMQNESLKEGEETTFNAKINLMNKHKKFAKKIAKLRTDKLKLGELMRLVRSQHYEKLSEDLKEVSMVRKHITGIKQYIPFIKYKRDIST